MERDYKFEMKGQNMKDIDKMTINKDMEEFYLLMEMSMKVNEMKESNMVKDLIFHTMEQSIQENEKIIFKMDKG